MKYVLILGGPLNGDKPSPLLFERIKKGAEFLKENPDSKAIVSGGIKDEKQPLSEAGVMKNSLIELGIEEERIIPEEKAKTTYENFIYSKELIESGAEVFFVTNEFHIWRSCKIMKKAHVGFTPLPAANGEDSLGFRIRECFLRPLAFFGIIW
ncbi:MAG: YdcF family protein [Eubacterium sp.]|nr:YdcF family protein [Eubacterium sp.]